MKPHQEHSRRLEVRHRLRRNASISVEPLEGRALLSMGTMSVPMNPSPVMTSMPMMPSSMPAMPSTMPTMSTTMPTMSTNMPAMSTNMPAMSTNMPTTPASTPTTTTPTNPIRTTSFTLSGNMSSILRPTMTTPSVMPTFPH